MATRCGRVRRRPTSLTAVVTAPVPRRLSFEYLDLRPWDEGRWRQVGGCLGCESPDDAVRAEIEHQVCLYLCGAGGRLGDRPPHVRAPAVRKRLGPIVGAAEALAARLEFGGQTAQEREEGRVASGRLARHAGLVNVAALPAILRALADGARAALPPLQDSGCPEDEPFDYLVWHLADLFMGATGCEATVGRDRVSDRYTSPFFTFMCVVAAELPGVLKEGTFAEKVRRALSRRGTEPLPR